MTIVEFEKWVHYRRKRGSLNGGTRTENGAALLATLFANSKRGSNSEPFSIYDFAEHLDEPELTLEQAMRNWS